MNDVLVLSSNCTVEVLNNFRPQNNHLELEHPNEKDVEIEPTCDNCRHKDSELQVCKDFHKMKRTLVHGKYTIKKEYCRFWSHQPVGLWSK